MNNKQIIDKADLALADLASGGVLSIEDSHAFREQLVAEPTILKSARKIQMSSSIKKIAKVGFGSRILRAVPSVGGLGLSERTKPDLGNIELNAKEVIAEIRLPYSAIEDAVGGGSADVGGDKGVTGSLKNSIISLMSKRAAIDLEELALLGDTVSTDPYLAVLDGFMKQASLHVVDNSSSNASLAMVMAGLKALPAPYQREMGKIANYLSVHDALDLKSAIGSRLSGGGDSVIQGVEPLAYGTKIVQSSVIRAGTGLLTLPENFVFGMQRDISLEFDKDISAREYIIVLTARIDFKIEEPNAVVKYINV